ncbi:efflux RND transporter permease subunit [Desulfotomaculum copahuensis]|uniref:Acriflavin resistance protein n=1 Tax=Desulfotomaculum copahuensis TaxID=1838280 RepID=A0A1B7LFV0_9FIRM|nr:efflux RND transporter permease subunit [Desulfotomaculum copahuensis]OAT83613.1 hypothetical protein A6M21_07985 [Desulfotomaculum copahuensis]
MHLTNFAVRKPVTIGALALFLIVTGFLLQGKLSVELFPAVDIPNVAVLIEYPGGSVQASERNVLKPLEDALKTVNGVKDIYSSAFSGSAVCALELRPGTDLNQAVVDVERKIAEKKNDLPPEIKSSVLKFDLNDRPVVTLALTSRSRSPEELYRLADDQIKDRLASLPGVGEVDVSGGRQREIDVAVDPVKLAGYGLSLAQISAAIKAVNFSLPGGDVKQGGREFETQIHPLLGSIRDLAAVPVPAGDNNVLLGDVAGVKENPAPESERVSLNGQPAVTVAVKKISSAGLVATSDAIRHETAVLQSALPPGVHLVALGDSSVFIREVLSETVHNLAEGIIITGLVLLVALRQWRSAMIAMLAIPTSLCAVVLIMYFAGISLNMLTLMAMIIAIGILVDDSIVILENIGRHMAAGKDPRRAAVEGREEIGKVAVAITMADVAVFAPLALVGGFIGQFFRDFGLVVVCATLISLLVSFTLTPMLAARYLHPSPAADERGTRRAHRFYRSVVRWSMRHRAAVILLTGATLAAVAALTAGGRIGTEFMSRIDTGRFFVYLELPPGSSLDDTAGAAGRTAKKLQGMAGVADVLATAGAIPNELRQGYNLAQLEVDLKPRRERKLSVWAIEDEVRGLQMPPGVTLRVAEDVLFGRATPPVSLMVTGPDLHELAGLAEKVENTVRSVPGTADVSMNWHQGQPTIDIAVDEQRSARMNLSPDLIAANVRLALQGETDQMYLENGREEDLRLHLAGSGRYDPGHLAALPVGSSSQGTVRLDQVADISYTAGPVEVNHYNGERMIMVSANTRGRPLGDVLNDIRRKLQLQPLPAGYRVVFQGEASDMQDSFQTMLVVLVLSVMMVYLILIILYESFTTPVLRMVSLPLALAGGILGLYLTGKTLNLTSMLGLIMVDGLVAKNGTLLIDYTHTLRQRGMSLRRALEEAGAVRMRPVLMTTATLVSAMLPAALALTPGSEARSGMAVVLISGLLFSTLLTLIVVPVSYTLIEDGSDWLRRKVLPGRRAAVPLVSPRDGPD